MTTIRLLLPALTLVLASSCATSAPSSAKAESSSAAIRAAEEVGAQHTPDAALHLQLAKEQFEHARTLTREEDRAWAERLRMRAQVDAELSLALARSETEKSEALGEIAKLSALKATAAP